MSGWSKFLTWLKGTYSFNYYRLHWMYICFMTLMGAVAIFFIEGQDKIPFADSLFMSASAITGAGLATVDLSQWHWLSQAAIATVMVVVTASLSLDVLLQLCERSLCRRQVTRIQGTGQTTQIGGDRVGRTGRLRRGALTLVGLLQRGERALR